MTELERLPEERVARNQLISRMALVAGLIVALLAAILIFDHRNDAKEVADTAALAVSANPPRIGVSVSGASPAALPEDLKQAIKDAPDAAQLALTSMSSPAADEPSPAVVSEGSSDVVMSKSSLPFSPPVIAKPQPRTGRDSRIERGQAESVKQPSSVATIPTMPHTVTSLREQGPFVLQLGVFSNQSNAEELRGKLKLAGISAQLETRVQVGPFANRDEATRAQEKLRQLGLGGGVLVATSKRP